MSLSTAPQWVRVACARLCSRRCPSRLACRQFAAIVNLNLAAMNALPLPGLDGGYLALQLAEAVRGGKRLPQQLERGIMSSGFLLLTATGLFLIVRDTLNLTGL